MKLGASANGRDVVSSALAKNTSLAGMADARIFVAPDPAGKHWVRVVHERLAELSEEDRRGLVLQGIEDDVSVAELISPEEEEWYGPPFRVDLENVPSWPEALSREPLSDPVRFASDLDDQISTPVIVTFYSLRGGVGRSTALAAAARNLASRGRRVLCIDMDFEAPGLSFLLGMPEPSEGIGALTALLALERGDEVDVRDHVLRASEAEELYCIPAGLLGARYAEKLRTLDPEIWYREAENPLHRLIDSAASSSISPDVILIDSRTGISPTSAPLLFDVSDLAVVCFFPHPQARRGTELLVSSLMRAKSRRSHGEVTLSPEPRFVVTPVPPGPSAAAVRRRAAEWIDEWVGGVSDTRSVELGQLGSDELMHSISYSPEVAFRDRVAIDAPGSDDYSAVADWIEQLLPSMEADFPDVVPGKDQVLRQLDFASGTAEDHENFSEDYVETRVSRQAADPRFPLVIGRKGTGKTAIFRRLLESADGEERPIAVYCPLKFNAKIPWAIGEQSFGTIEGRVGAERWPTFWACYTALASFLSAAQVGGVIVFPPERFSLDISELSESYDELAVVDALRSMLDQDDANLLALRWLREIDKVQSGGRFLLFDGLDTGFGSGVEGRGRRSRAVTGLLTFLTETEPRLANLKFKVMLRFDIWQQLRFENKSHLYGRSVQLTWRDPNEYFKTVLKQAVRSEGFKRQVEVLGINSQVDEWDDVEVGKAWDILVGERMKGGKTAFTKNWVWNRLADGQGDHSPRTLSQLFHEAVQWEQAEEGRTSYDRSVIRPRALIASLGVVSGQAVQSLAEEFRELDSLVDVLRELGRTPVEASDIKYASSAAAEEVDLALETGLLAIYEGTQDDARRYRVPDLYRYGLGMTRKGQA